jgi:hypothetical protein
VYVASALQLLADPAEQPLGRDHVQRRRHVERLQPHVDHARDGGRRVVGVQRREQEVAGERRLDGDPARLDVPDLTHHDDVGVLAQERLQRGGERHPDLVADLDLVDPVEVVLHRVLRRHDVDVLVLIFDSAE